MDLLCIAAQHDPIGYVAVNNEPLSLEDISRMIGGSETEVATLLADLERNGVFSRNRRGTIYSRRMVRDGKKSRTAQENGKLGGNPSLRKDLSIYPSDKPPDKTRVKPHKPEAISQKKDAAPGGAASDEVQLFRRGREVLGENSGGLIANLLKAKGRSVALARSAVEVASTKDNPREYVGRIIAGQKGDHAERNKLIEEIRIRKGSAVVLATEVPGGIPGVFE